MSISPEPDVTQMLQDGSAGDRDAAEKLMPVIYDELRRLARHYLSRERPDHTLQATALVHEAYVKIVDQNRVTWQNRAHFAGVAARLMRRILLQHARARHTAKRGGGIPNLCLDEAREVSDKSTADLIALDDVLKDFTRVYPREGEVVELKFFGGMETKEIAEFLKVSPKTILRDWQFAKLWLRRALNAGS